MFSLSSNGTYTKTETYLKKLTGINLEAILASNGKLGVSALAAATPVDSGLSSQSWSYRVESDETSCTLIWENTDVENGFPVAIMLQYGYSTGTGGYVYGRDYINPAMKPVFDQIEANVWKAVSSSR